MAILKKMSVGVFSEHSVLAKKRLQSVCSTFIIGRFPKKLLPFVLQYNLSKKVLQYSYQLI